MFLNSRDDALIYSDLGGPYFYDGNAIEIVLYRLPDSDWVVELSDEESVNIVLEDFYPSEESAYAAALEAIREGVMDRRERLRALKEVVAKA
jgi:hypothetical protein